MLFQATNLPSAIVTSAKMTSPPPPSTTTSSTHRVNSFAMTSIIAASPEHQKSPPQASSKLETICLRALETFLQLNILVIRSVIIVKNSKPEIYVRRPDSLRHSVQGVHRPLLGKALWHLRLRRMRRILQGKHMAKILVKWVKSRSSFPIDKLFFSPPPTLPISRPTAHFNFPGSK